MFAFTPFMLVFSNGMQEVFKDYLTPRCAAVMVSVVGAPSQGPCAPQQSQRPRREGVKSSALNGCGLSASGKFWREACWRAGVPPCRRRPAWSAAIRRASFPTLLLLQYTTPARAVDAHCTNSHINAVAVARRLDDMSVWVQQFFCAHQFIVQRKYT
jgi:hypothetical protein